MIFPRTLIPVRSAGFLLVILFTISTSGVYSQVLNFQESWRWAHFTTESGLPSDAVTCIAETPDSIIWAGTKKGLAWFDGFYWNTVAPSLGLPSGKISVIEPFGADSVLVIDDDSLYVGSRKGFKRLAPFDSSEGGVKSVAVAERHKIYFLRGPRLYVITSTGFEPVKIPAQPISVGSRNFWRTASGSLWLNTVRGLYRGDGVTWRLTLPVDRNAFTFASVVENKRGEGLVASLDPRELEGVWEWNRSGRPRANPTERSAQVTSLDISPTGDVIAAYQSGEVRKRSHGIWSPLDPPPIEFTSTLAVKFTRGGDLLVGTERGLFLFRATSTRWSRWKHPFGDLRNGVHEIYRTSDGSIWLGTFKGLEIHRPSGRIDYFENILGTSLGTVTAIAQDKDRNVWIGSGASFQGAFRWDGRTWKHFGSKEGLNTDRIHKIRVDRKGRLWFLGLGGFYTDRDHQPGAFLLDKGRFENIPPKTSTVDGLVNGRVYGFVEGKDGSYWFATAEGLSRRNHSGWKHWTREDGLSGHNSRIYTIAVDSSGTIWFSNVSDGLGTIGKDDKVHFFTTRDGLSNNSIWDLKVDSSGTLWMSSEGGLSSYKNGIWSNFTIGNGLGSSHLWDILPLMDKVYAGSPGAGVNILVRSKSSPVPKISFSNVSFQGTTALVRWKVFPHFGEIDPRDVEIRYRVDTAQWSGWSLQREIELHDLATGSHTIELQAKNLFGEISPRSDLKEFSIEPRLYERPVFILSVVLLAASFLILGGTYLQRKRKYQKSLQESDERFHLVATTTADVIYDWNLVTNALWINDPERAVISGTQPPLMSSKGTWMGYVHPEDRAGLEKVMSEAVAGRTSAWQAEYRFLKRDGTYGHMLHRGHFRFDDEGKTVRALGSIMEITERKEAEALSRSISRRIIQAQENERRRVSRELHDSANQILASVKFRIESLEEQLSGQSTRIRREAQKTRLLLNKVMAEIRRISRNLRPAELDDLGLASAVRTLADEFGERTKIETIVKDVWPRKTLSPEVSVTLYRIIQESLTNVEKHSRAKRVRISCMETANEIVCTIEDNGSGIRTDEHGKGKLKGDGLGLLDMQERLSFIGGSLELSSIPRHGTTVTIHIPQVQTAPQEKSIA